MSALETAARPLLSEAILHGSAFSLERNDAVTIARWLFKFAVIGDGMRGPRQPELYSRDERHLFARTLALPPGTFAWMARVPPGGGFFRGMYGESDPEFAHIFKLNAFTFVLNSLLFQIVTVRGRRTEDFDLCRTGAWDLVSTRFWPATDESAEWPPGAFIDDPKAIPASSTGGRTPG